MSLPCAATRHWLVPPADDDLDQEARLRALGLRVAEVLPGLVVRLLLVLAGSVDQ